MSSVTKVTQVLAADMVGKSRITIARHIKDGTLSKDADGKIDVSELRRVYGDDILTPEQVEEKKKTQLAEKEDDKAAQELEFIKKQLDLLTTERVRERELLTEQIDLLKERLEKSEEREKNITLLLTHQTKESAEERVRKQEKMEEELKTLKETLEQVKKQQDEEPPGFFSRIFGGNRRRS
ncbi:MAG: hypothetical protein KDI90_12440 [Alphaproteobacteria bacterium]|nr:hypothetical protein [Alphaproteobacteria bacterium]